MEIGLYGVCTDETLRPDEMARLIEDAGFDALAIGEHTHIPANRESPYPGGELPEGYTRTLDLFIALNTAALATTRLKVSSSIMQLAQRDPIVTAKEVATLDLLSNGRFVLGMGFGWNADEIEHHGVAMPTRRARAREHVLAMQALWRDDVASYEGEYVSFSPSWSWPKPVQPGGPPVLIGGAAGPKMFAHIAEYANGWIPIGGAGVKAALPELRQACEARDRDPASLRIVPFVTVPDGGKLEYYASIGIDEVVLRLPSAGRDRVLPLLDDYASLTQA